ncbi:hypothetical protein [Roseibium sp. Sym1]|uniref:hypothetical protein n=1 Tax=Roseibium sp. Sym1 TaxID=3016006 RepID=UPI0022B4A2E0|nr:hypothetical protein [Roseibium sp. Sym1]
MQEFYQRLDGRICAISPLGSGEYFFCGDAFDCDGSEEGQDSKALKGGRLVTCPDCVDAITSLRKALPKLRCLRA